MSIRPLSLPIDLSSRATSRGASKGLKTSQGRRKKRKNIRAQGDSKKHATTINILPDNVLLEIFDSYRKDNRYSHNYHPYVWQWHFLVHVCRRWRQIVLASSHRLHLRIFCTHGIPVRKNLGSWPAFPIVIHYSHGYPRLTISPNDEDNIIAALEHPDRIYDVVFDISGSQLEKIAKVMQEPFPVLTSLSIRSEGGNALDLPNEFLGASAPNLQQICLSGIPYPSLPTLLLSASNVVELKLHNIPQTGYISPEVMVACLATLTMLKSISIGFQSPTSRPDRILLPPGAWTVLPALTSFSFWGVREYLEDFAARISAPRLDSIDIRYLNQLTDFQVPQISNFIDRSEHFKRSLSRRCCVVFDPNGISFSVYAKYRKYSTPFRIYIRCQGIDWQVSHITQALGHISAITSDMVYLAISQLVEPHCQPESMDDIEWLQLLSPFSSVRALFLSRQFAGYVARALEEGAEETATELLPALDFLCLEDQLVSSVDEFLAVRRIPGRPVTFVNTKAEYDRRLGIEYYLN